MSKGEIQYDQFGRVITNDEELNRIIREVEVAQGRSIQNAIPAVTFEDDPNEKVYLILLTIFNDDEDRNSSSYMYKEWTVMIGRQNTYDYLKTLIKNEAIDPSLSFVIAGNTEKKENTEKEDAVFNSKAITVFRFMKVMYDSNKILDDGEGFDINDYDPSYEYSGSDNTILDII